MRGQIKGLGSLPDFSPERFPFYVPGERHENLPAGGFAGRGFGTPVYTLIPDTRAPEYATGGSGMFQGPRQMADFGYGKVVPLHSGSRRHLGQDDEDSGTDWASLLSQGLSTVSDVAQAVGPAEAQASTPATAVAASARPASAPVAAAQSILKKKVAGIPVVALVAIGAAAAFFIIKKKKR